MEDHFHSHCDGRRTLKLKTCGHYFHLECVRDWLNGPSPNSNLCPECRVQFSGTRRHVRPIQPSVQPSVQPPGRPSVATVVDSLSDDSEDRLSSVDLDAIGLAIQPPGRPSVAAPLGILPDDSEDSWTSDDSGSNYSDIDVSGSDDSSSDDSDSDSIALTTPPRRLTEADLDGLGLGSNLEVDLDAGPQPDTAQSDAQPEPPASAPRTNTSSIIESSDEEDDEASQDEELSDASSTYSETYSEPESDNSYGIQHDQNHYESGLHGTTLYGIEAHDTETFQQAGTTHRTNVAEWVHGVMGDDAAEANELPASDDDVDMTDGYHTMRAHRDEEEVFEWDMEVEDPDADFGRRANGRCDVESRAYFALLG
jgi:hypothetical protein